MDPPGSNAEPEEFDYSLLDLDPDSLLDAWVKDLLVAGDHSTQQDGRPIAMPPENIFSNMDTSFGGSNLALATDFDTAPWTGSTGHITAGGCLLGPLGPFQISDIPQDCVPGLDPPMINLQGAGDFSMSGTNNPIDFQFSAEGDHNPTSDAAMQDVSLSSWENSISSGAAVSLQDPSSTAIRDSDFASQTGVSRTTHNIDRLEGQLFNGSGSSQNTPPTSCIPSSSNHQGLRPNIQTRTKLPPKRRGGRRGKLSAAQARQQRETKLSGVCIRCRRCRIRCYGGIPCGPCIKILGKSRIWTTPCTKAQFLDIIEAGSSLPFVVRNEIVLFKNLDIQSMMMLMGPLKTMLQQESGQYVVVQSTPLGDLCQIPWAIVGHMLVSLFGNLHEGPCNWKMPSSSKVASTLADYARGNSFGGLVKLITETEEPHTPQWVKAVMAFCHSLSYQQPPQSTIDSTLPRFPADDAGRLTSSLLSWTGWVASRYLELYLFHYLQVTSNNTSFDSVEDQKSYILCIFNILLLSTYNFHKVSMHEKDPRMIPLYREVFDRRSRVQSALWVYCSIAVRGLPAWTNIWETIHQNWPFIQVETMAQHFYKSAAAFKTSLKDTVEPVLDSFGRFQDYCSVLFIMHSDFEEGVDRKREAELDFMKYGDAYFGKYLFENRLDGCIEDLDQQATGGLLSAQTTSQKRGASTHAFATLAIIDWRRKPVLPWDPDCTKPVPGRQDLLQSFVQLVFGRFVNMVLYSIATKQCPTGTPLEEFIWNVMSSENSSLDPQRSREFLKNSVRRGRRWNELQDMVGLEVILIHDPLRNPGCDLQPFYIPSIVDNGTDRQFTRLKKIIPTRLQWLAEACVELRGLVHMLKTASATEGENATFIQDQIQTMVTATFGSRPSVEGAVISRWVQQGLFPQGLPELFQSEAATIPLDIKVGMSLCLLDRLDTHTGEKPDILIDFEMKENVCREAKTIMELDCSTLDSDNQSELRVWSHKVLDCFSQLYSC